LLLAAAVIDRADDSLRSSLFAGGLPAVISTSALRRSPELIATRRIHRAAEN
jgi:hypothetical protein